MIAPAEAALRALAPALAAGGAGVRTLIHAEDPAPLARLLNDSFPGMDLATVADYASLPAQSAAFRPDLCLSYRFGPGYPRAALFASGVVYVHVAGTGFDHLAPWDPDRVVVCNSSGFQSAIMADYVLGVILALNLNLPRFLDDARAGLWRPARLSGIAGQRATVLGTGAIGAAIGARLRGAGMDVTGVSRGGRAAAGFDRVHPVAGLDALLPQTDHLVLVLPQTPETEGLISDARLALLPAGACVVNVARGAILDEEALAGRLAAGQLRGAALDVFRTEPLPADSPLRGLPGLILTPHSSALFEGWQIAAAERFVANLRAVAQGAALSGQVSPTRGY